MKKLKIILLFFLPYIMDLIKTIQLCDPYNAPYPCTSCQPYAKVTSGLCNCLPGYYMNVADQNYEFCDLCHASCQTCYGPLSTNCISCPTSFTFESLTASCIQSNSVTDQVILSAYSIEGFTKLTGWTLNSFSADTFQCGLRTLLGGTRTAAGNSIQVVVSSLPNHFRIRVKANFYFFNANNTAKKATVSIGSNVNQTDGSEYGYPFQSCAGRNYVTRAVDVSILHTGASATIIFQSNVTLDFGIRDVIIIAQKCSSNCTTCSGYNATQCLTCSDNKRLATLLVAGTCQCNHPYYQEPFAGTCVDPCPSVPIKYYGDNSTKNCVTSCPTSSFAYDDLMRCWTDCPTTSIRTSKNLYRDYTNRRCVSNCPSTQPYGDPVDRKCYAVCPSPRYGDNTTDKICVATCPHSYLNSLTTYKTYASGSYCVPYCPSGSWADPATAKCLATCTSTAFPLMDNSTGQNLCVASCPGPNRFKEGGSCIQICPSGKYGDITNWQCTGTCTAPNWGLQSYNRKCVPKCPSNTWARTSSRTCVNTTSQCNPLFANDYSRQCVAATSCPYGTYADPTTYYCVTYCPNGTYGHPTTRVCQSNCVSPYFADPGVNLCVTSCQTIGLYADVYSNRKCVTACNQTGPTPWADDSNRTCVSDCNNTMALYLADNTTWKCVFECPLTHVADFTTTAPKCVITCPSGWFADSTSGIYRICVQKCSANPPQFGDTNGSLNLCVDVCAPGTFGDETGNRLCGKTCPSPYFSQNDDLRRCVKVCNETSYGYQQTCTYHITDCPYSYKRLCYQTPKSCPSNWFGDNSTQLCVNPCPASQVTFGDPESKYCVRTCPNNPNYTSVSTFPRTYYADISNRKCVLTCNSSYNPPLFGSNSTRTCQSKCLDFNAYSEPQSTYRICVDRCWRSPNFFYANNLTKTCGSTLNCPSNYYGQNETQLCVQFCPNTSWGYRDSTRRVCLNICPSGFKGDDSTTKRICVPTCPDIPDRYADLNLRICVDMCNNTLYGDPSTRQCVPLCPSPYFSYEPTRRCIAKCPIGYFADDRVGIRKCQPSSALCTGRFGDSFKRQCVSICTGPTPVDTFGSGPDCVSFCPNGTYADSYSSSRLCVGLCPPGVLNSIATPNLYGDPTTHTCVSKCITPYTWADRQTRLCQPICSATPNPSYSQNFYMTCVSSLNCPITPTMTFGDNSTRSCVSFCSNGWWGDPVSRNCVFQCPNVSTTGTSRYFADNSTGQPLCVVICPQLPRLFGQNTTNKCVSQCPSLTYGDQTGNRSCVPQCPLFGSVYHFAQNYSRICVLVCIDGNWGLKSTRQCVENPFHCGALWADNTTHLCVSTCPASSNLFGDPNTRICVPICPNNSYADDLTRTCVTRCPTNNGVHDTFGNNDTWICQQNCTQPNVYADPQTLNRYCVIKCSQSPTQSFADPSSKFCVPRCPTFPSLFAETQNYTCVKSCISPYFADTHTRRCVLNCDNSTQFKLRDPRSCVKICPSTPQLFGDSGTGFCQTTCSSGYRYAILRKCVSSCLTYSQFDYNGTCVTFCPFGYYADSNGHCVSPCPLATLFGQNTTTTCVPTCITGFAYNRLCLAICPDGLYGYNNVCQLSCPSGTASNISNLCVSNCDFGTFRQNSVCVANCSVDYADPNTRLCSTSCTLGRYKQPTSKRCVELCPVGSYRDPSFSCKTNCSPLRADNITATCTSICSNGTWGYNNTCISQCPPSYFGYETDRDCYNIPNIPNNNLFADNITKTWVSVCSINPLKFGDRQSHQCVTACSASNQYTDPSTRKCETACQNSSYYRDPTTKSCVLICPQGLNANPQTRFCQYNCTSGRFDYDITHICVTSCPKPFYGYQNGTQKVCVLQCLGNTFAQDDLCKSQCTLPLVADFVTHRCVEKCIDSFASTDEKACVNFSICSIYNKIADNSSNRCVDQCPTDPDFYNQNGICVPYCRIGTFADPTSGVRQCKSLCTEGLYGDPVSGRCVLACLPGYYAFNDTNLCVKQCPNGFADNQTGVCVSICPSPTFADSLNNKCMRICSNGQFGQGRVCVPTCTDPLYGNPITMQCEVGCPDFDYTFAQNFTNKCVRNCSIVANSYADRFNNFCMDKCSQPNQYALDVFGICTSLCPQGLFMQNSTKKCQTGCTTGFAQKTSRFCVARCFGNPQTFAHESNRQCVYKCKTPTENLYADNSTNYCVSVTNCSRVVLSFSDPISGNCVLFCPQGLYSEDTNFTCTNHCIIGFADNLTRRCVPRCPSLQETYGDPNSKRCVKVCPDGWFANNASQQCVNYNNCPSNTWSDIISKHCVARCPSVPLYFGYDGSTSCVSICPSNPDLYGDNVTQKCIWPCSTLNGELRFADPISRTCVFVCPITLGLYGDPTTGKCTDTCHINNKFKDNSTQRCRSTCPSNPDYYAYSGNNTCVRVCPSGLYASDPTSRICSTTCQPWLKFKDDTTNRCVNQCPIPYFADNSTYKCVIICPQSPDYYADPHTQNCVFVCPIGPNGPNGLPIWRSWIQDINRTCVTRCPSSYYAQNSSGRCVSQCPINQYADPILQICVAQCTVRPGYYKQTGARKCVKNCPNTPIKAHKYQPTHICVNMSGTISGCLNSHYADQLTNMCTTKCPNNYYADDNTLFCRLNCTNGQYADPVLRRCRSTCTTNPAHFAFSGNMTCLRYCPSPLFSENKTYTCTSSCPNMTNGDVLYSFTITRQCLLYCPPPYYSYIMNQTCLLNCPDGWFAIDETRECSRTCSGQYYADDSINKCVQVCPFIPNYYGLNNICISNCPNGTFKDNSTRTCVAECPYLPLTFADDSINQCVQDCPSTPNYFADNITRTCVSNCSEGTFADPSTRTCVQNCPQNSGTYAQPVSRVCQPYCPSPKYASDLTNECVDRCPNVPVKTYAVDNGRYCSTRCPNGLFGNNQTRKCEADCYSINNSFADSTTNLCVSTCPIGFFAFNSTAECRRDCPGLYADSTTRKCVLQCPGTQRLYADPSTNTCVYICPLGWYGNSDRWVCETSCANVTSGYILQVQRLCVIQCPSPYFALVSQRLCVKNCGTGWYGDQVSRQCKTCPITCTTCLGINSCLSCAADLFLQFGLCVSSCTLNLDIANYANNVSMTCGSSSRCQPFTFGLNSTKTCQSSCPIQMYANSSTRTCQNCPSTCQACSSLLNCSLCITFAEFAPSDNMCYAHCNTTAKYSYNGVCFQNCPGGSFADYTGVTCLDCNVLCFTCYGTSLNCTSCDGTFLHNNTCLTKCPDGYYGNNGICTICDNSNPSCTKPLTFSTSTTVQDYQQVIVVKFNQQTSVNAKPEDFMKISLKMKRRLIQSGTTSVINNGITFKSVVLPDGTMKLYLDPGVSLQNVQYAVSFTDPTKITTKSGASLQNLQQVIQLAKAEVYPDSQTVNAPLVIAGKILAIVMLVLSFGMLLFGLTPIYLAIQAIQMMSLLAYNKSLAPNLFYFLKQMRLSRFIFMPNIFSNIYVAPTGFVEAIPQKIIDVEGQLSFSINGTSFIIFFFFYIVMALVVFLFTSKVNNNRPLKNLFIRIWQTRIKFGIIHDFLWLFSLNILTQCFLQFRYTENGADLGLAIVWALFTLFLMITLFAYGVKKYKQDPESILDNYSSIFAGVKDEGKHKFFIFIYYLRKIVFAAIIAGAVFNTQVLCIVMLCLYSLVGLFVLIIRPYKEHLTNFISLANQCFLGFFCGGVIFYLKMIDRGQPSGAKITNGFILSIVTIVHLSLLFCWGIYRSYIYLKQLHQSFKKSEFYLLYMDQQYDEILQKEISELNEVGKDEVQSIQVTNVGGQDGKDGQQQVIRLKIKRRRKKQKIGAQNLQSTDRLEQQKVRQNDKYVKVQKENQNYYKLKAKKDKKQNEFEKVVFDVEQDVAQEEQNKYRNRIGEEEKKEKDWVKIQNSPNLNVYTDPKNKQIEQQQGYKETKIQNIFDEQVPSNADLMEERQDQNKEKDEQNLIELSDKKQQIEQVEMKESNLNALGFEQIINREDQNQEDEEKKKIQKHLQMDRKMRETFKSSFADFDEANYFNHEDQQVKQEKQEKREQKVDRNEEVYKQNKNQKAKAPLFEDESEVYSQQFDHQILQSQQNDQRHQNIQGNQNQEKKIATPEKYSQLNSNRDQQQVFAQKNNTKKQQQYKVFNFDEMNFAEEKGNQKPNHDRPKLQTGKKEWSVDVQDLLDDNKNVDEQEKKRKENSKKMHLMLFEDDED